MTGHEWETQAQNYAEARLVQREYELNHSFEHDPSITCRDCPLDMAGDAYCGCETCIVREVLDAAWPALAELAVATYLSLPPGTEPPWRNR